MAGNVAEWVADVYRPIVDDEFNDFNYYRGNDYKKFVIDGERNEAVLAEQTEYKTLSNGKKVAIVREGEIMQMDLENSDLRNRTQFDKSYNINFRDGDKRSTRAYDEEGETQTMYKSPDLNNISDSGVETTLISDQVRVYKGGSWKDRAYWLDPAQRRFYHEDQATDFIGFRCVMSRLGGKSLDMKKRSRN